MGEDDEGMRDRKETLSTAKAKSRHRDSRTTSNLSNLVSQLFFLGHFAVTSIIPHLHHERRPA